MRYLILLFLSFNLFAYEIYEGVEYCVTTEDSLTLGWNASEGAEFYEVKSKWTDPKTDVETFLGRTSGLTFVINRTRVGHFIYMVRAGKMGSNGQEVFSTWATSDDKAYAVVNGEPMPWRVYFQMKPVDDVIID